MKTTTTAVTVPNPKHSNCKGNKRYKLVKISSTLYAVKSRCYGLHIDIRDLII